MESVTDAEAFQAMHLLAKMEGLSVEPATAVAFAGLIKLVENGTIAPDEYVVVNCTGHTMPIEEELLGEDWARDVIHAEGVPQEGPHEGLLSALRVYHRRVREVLIVDDNNDARRLVRRILQAQGHFEVVEAESGQEALGLAETNPPDLIILDLMMPVMDGFQVLQKLKDNSATQSIPVIMVTAKGQEQDQQTAIRIGAYDYITKPWGPDEVEPKVIRAEATIRK